MTADRLIRFYPRAWRERYGAEFLETVGPSALHLQQVIDIAMGAVDAWLSAEVRRSAAGAAMSTNQGGKTMVTTSKVFCSDSKLRMTIKDGWISAGVLLAGTVLLTGLGIGVNRSGHHELGEVIKSLSFPVSMTASMPFGVMKGQPWRAQAFVLGVTFIILIAAGYLSMLI